MGMNEAEKLINRLFGKDNQQEELIKVKKELQELKEQQKTANEKRAKEYLDTFTKPRIIELCLQYMYDNKLLEKQLEQAQTRISELEDKDWYEANIKQLEEQNDRLIQERDNLKQQLAELKAENKILKEFADKL